MNLTKILAGLLLVLAIVLGVAAWMLGRPGLGSLTPEQVAQNVQDAFDAWKAAK